MKKTKAFGKFENAECITNKGLLERWENCLRVLKGLTRRQRKHHFVMWAWGYRTPDGPVACAGGHCGFDPWFRRRGFQFNLDEPNLSFRMANPHDFFGGEGVRAIFAGDCNTYPEVVAKVKEYIKVLKRRAADARAGAWQDFH